MRFEQPSWQQLNVYVVASSENKSTLPKVYHIIWTSDLSVQIPPNFVWTDDKSII